MCMTPHDYCQREPTLYLLSLDVTLPRHWSAQPRPTPKRQLSLGRELTRSQGQRQSRKRRETHFPSSSTGSDFIMPACRHTSRDHEAAEVRGVPQTQLTSWSMPHASITTGRKPESFS